MQSDPIKTAKDRVEEWLGEKGARLELDVASAFREHLRDVGHARYYVDSATGKVREIDVLAQCLTRTQAQNAFVSTWFVVECKSSTAAPWVLYRSRPVSDFTHRDTVVLPRDMLVTASRGVALTDIEERTVSDALGTIWADPGPYAYQIADTGGNEAYAAVQQVLSGVEGARSDFSEDPGKPTLAIFVPVVVTAAPLFTVDVHGSGYDVNETPTFVPLIARLRASEHLRLIWIVQADHVRDYVSVATKGAEALRLKRTFAA